MPKPTGPTNEPSEAPHAELVTPAVTRPATMVPAASPAVSEMTALGADMPPSRSERMAPPVPSVRGPGFECGLFGVVGGRQDVEVAQE